MPPEASKDRQKRYSAGRVQNLLKEYGAILEEVAKEVVLEYSQEINEDSIDKIALKYATQQGARQGMILFMKKLNSKANE